MLVKLHMAPSSFHAAVQLRLLNDTLVDTATDSLMSDDLMAKIR